MTMLEYFQKSTCVFDENGMISKEQLKEMKERAANNRGNLWHGYISFNREDSKKIDHPEKCFDFLKRTFPAFFKEVGFDRGNIDLMCALHLDKKVHYHIHYCFWEKEATIVNKKHEKYPYFRKKGKIPKSIIMRMTERVNAFTLDDEIAKRRDEAIDALKVIDGRYIKLRIKEDVCQRIQELADELPKGKPLWYGSKDIQPYRDKIDWIVDCLKMADDEFERRDLEFQIELRKKETSLREKMKGYYDEIKKSDDCADAVKKDMTKPKEIACIERLRYDYKRRLGNIVLSKVKYVQTHTFTYDRKQKRKSNDKRLKTKIAISERTIGKSLDRFFGTVVGLFTPEYNSHRSRLAEIEQELNEGYKAEQRKAALAEEKRRAKAEAEEETKSAQNGYSGNQKG